MYRHYYKKYGEKIKSNLSTEEWTTTDMLRYDTEIPTIILIPILHFMSDINEIERQFRAGSYEYLLLEEK